MYCTVDQILADVKATDAVATAQPTIDGKKYLLSAIDWIVARIDDETKQTFAPLIQTRYYDATQDNVDWYRNMLLLSYPLISASSVVINDQTLTQWNGSANTRSTSDYTYRHYGRTPYYALQGLAPSSAWNPYQWGVTYGGAAVYAEAIAVAGTWGYRTFYSTQAFQPTGDSVQNNPLTSGSTSITVTDADGVTYDGSTPRFSPGQMIQIETEWLQIRAVDTVTNTLTVERGIRGSTAASHAQNTAISTYVPEPSINRAAIRWCAYLYHRRAVYQNFVISADGGSSIQFPPDVPPEVAGTLQPYTLAMARVAAV